MLRLSTRLGLSALLGILVMSGCAHQSSRPQQSSDALSSNGQNPAASPHELPSYRTTDPEPPHVADPELDSIPTEVNPRVEQWVKYFQGRGRPHMERYLARSTRYSGVMKRILKQNGMPEDLIYIALIESGFSSRATSRAAAVGYWQFIKPTGRRYGLEINSFIDERRDPVLSTQAAAEYYKTLYGMFGSWYLAMASYNVGENRVLREVKRNYTRDFWELARKRRLPKETVNYVPKYIAAKLIGKNPEAYGFTNIDYEPPIEFELIKVDKSVNLRQMAEKMNFDYDDLKQLNPKFRGEIAPTRAQTGQLELRIPVGQAQQALAAAQQSTVEKLEFIADAGETETYRIRSGDSLYTIARKHRTTVAWLRDVNDLKPGKKLRIGMRIQVPDRTNPKRSKPVVIAKQAKQEKKVEDAEQASTNAEVVTNQGVYYIVQPGDTLSEIADEYDSTVTELRRMNKLNRGSVLKAGMKLKVPKDDGLPADLGRPGSKLSVPLESRDERQPASVKGAKISKKSPKTVLKPRRNKVHVVKRGDNLMVIANRYNVSVDSIRETNRLQKGSKILTGARIIIPSASAHD